MRQRPGLPKEQAEFYLNFSLPPGTYQFKFRINGVEMLASDQNVVRLGNEAKSNWCEVDSLLPAPTSLAESVNITPIREVSSRAPTPMVASKKGISEEEKLMTQMQLQMRTEAKADMETVEFGIGSSSGGGGGAGAVKGPVSTAAGVVANSCFLVFTHKRPVLFLPLLCCCCLCFCCRCIAFSATTA
jgi:hypothetical protein